jgi:hypothetical protein
MYIKICHQNIIYKVIVLIKFGINFLLLLAICVLFISVRPCFSTQMSKSILMVNPLWKGKTEIHIPVREGLKSGTFQSIQNTASSYNEFENVLIRGMAERKSPITVYFSSNMSRNELKNWNDSFWGSSNSPNDSQLFQKIPWLFWAWKGLQWVWSFNSQGLVTKIVYNINYDYDSNKEKALKTDLITTVKQIVSSNMDMITREKIIHDWIVNHVNYDQATLMGSSDMGYNEYSAFVKGLAVCSGYARLTNRMLFMAGIPNLIVDGIVTNSTPSGEHAWNMVNLNNDWYQLDTTWDDLGLYGDTTVHYEYFNITDSQISRDHSWDENFYPQALKVFNESQYQGQIDDQCSIFETNLCNNEIDCINIGGIWNGDYCTINQASSDDNHNAAPSQALPIVEFPIGVTPSSNEVQVGACNYVMIQPSLSVPSVDVGKTATLIMYIYLPDLNFGITIPSRNKVLTSETKFDLLPNAIDFSGSAGMNFYIYYGYVIGSTIKYNAYSIEVGVYCEN